MKRWFAGFGIALGLGLVLYALFAANSDEERIRERLDQLARALSTDDDENLVFRKSRLDRELEQVLTDEVHVDVPELGADPHGRSAVARLALAAGQRYGTLDVDIDPATVAVHDDQADVEARVDVTSTGDRAVRERRDVTFRFVKDPPHDWRIAAARVQLPAR